MNYPNVIFFRYDNYCDINTFIEINKNKFNCNFNIISNYQELNKLYNSNYHLLVTYGPDETEYYSDVNRMISNRMRKRWIHYTSIENIEKINQGLNYCYMSLVNSSFDDTRTTFSIFTTCYNSYEKILRAYKSVQSQTWIDWEWVILDDSPDDLHFQYLKQLFENDHKIRLYKRSSNSGSIGDVKNEVVSLCRGKYVIELDHDDEILPDVLKDSVETFEKDPEIGFIYMDFSNIYENGENCKYVDCFSLGYSSYYMQKYRNRWIYVAMTPNINNITLSHIVSVPNHPRIWRKKTLIDIGNYSEWLPIADDYELILRTAVSTKMAKIHKLGYIQYMNNGNNNFSLIRNKEINRLVPRQLKPHCYETYNIHDKMKQLDAYEDPIKNTKDSYKQLPIWKRNDFEYKYCNSIVQLNYRKQYCIVGLSTFYKNLEKIHEIYEDPTNDIILLDSLVSPIKLTKILDEYLFFRMKCYAFENHSDEELIRYFMLLYKSCDEFEIIHEQIINHSKKIEELPFVENPPKITIITPCIRPENLNKIFESIRFEFIQEWIIIYDGKKIFENPYIFTDHSKIKEVLYFDKESISGNSQRNYGLSLVSHNTPTYIYFLDDDNIIHHQLYNLLPHLETGKIYTFNQSRSVDIFPYKDILKGDQIKTFHIDTAMYLLDYSICKHLQWQKDKYNADGIFIEDCYKNNKENWIFINETMAYYNVI